MNFSLRIVAAIVLLAGMAGAQVPGPDPGAAVIPKSNALSLSSLTRQVMNDPNFKRGLEGIGNRNPSGVAPVTFRDAGRTKMPAKLAQTYPAAMRSQVEQAFNGILDAYPKMEKLYGLPHNDLAGSVAVFLVCSYQAASGIDVSDSQVKTVIAQMRAALASNPYIVKAPDAAKQEMHEQMAILGMFLAGVQQSLKQGPNPQMAANVKKAGEDYLRAFLGAEPVDITIGNGGMTLASAASRSPRPPVASTTSAEPTKSNAHSAVASEASRIADSIETVGFYNKLGYGYGGMFTYNTTPIVLFKSGEALYDMGALQFPGGLAAHKAAHPQDWTKWRRTGNAIEVIGKKGWERIAYTTTMDRLRPGFTLSGKYEMLSGGGNVALGGKVGIAVWRDLIFDVAGNFATGGGTGLSDSGSIEGTSTVLSTQAPERHGRYTIDGYALTLNYADGHVERRMIVTDPNDTKAIWLDGHGYVKQKQ